MSRARGQRRCVDQGRGHAGAHGATGVTLIRVAATLAPLALSIRARRARGPTGLALGMTGAKVAPTLKGGAGAGGCEPHRRQRVTRADRHTDLASMRQRPLRRSPACRG